MFGWGIKNTPLRLQVEPIECGAIVCGIVLEYFGCFKSNFELKKEIGVCQDGANLFNIAQVLKKFGFQIETKKLLAHELKNFQDLAILFFDSCHFVVFEGYSQGYYFINDPACGRYRLKKKEFHQRFDGVALFVKSQQKTVKTREKISNYFVINIQIISGVFGAIFGLLLVFCVLFFAEIVSKYVFIKFGNLTRINLYFVCCIILVIILISVYFYLMNYWYKYYFNFVVQKITGSLFKIPTTSLVFYSSNIMKKIIINLDEVVWNLLVVKSCRVFLCLCLMVLALLSIVYEADLTWAYLGVLLFYSLKFYYLSKKESIYGLLFSHYLWWQKLVLNYPDIHAMGQHEKISENFVNFKQGSGEKNIQAEKYILFIAVLFVFFGLFEMGTLSHKIATGILFLLVCLLGELLLVVGDAKEFAHARALWEDMESGAKTILNYKTNKNSASLVELSNIYFAPRGMTTKFLSKIDMKISVGEIIGIVGDDGLKTGYLLKIIAGICAPDSGEIKIGNDQLGNLKINYIDENSQLFAGTLRENICFYDNKIGDDKVISALKNSCAEELYLNRPGGLISLIKKGGQNLSVGQKKRLLLARALVMSPSLLVLDNYFDSLHDSVAQEIINNIRKLKITLLYTSYRLSLLQQASNIFCLKEGQIAIQGQHSQLLSSSKLYEDLVLGRDNVL